MGKPQLTAEEQKQLKEAKKLAKQHAVAEAKRQLKRDELTREIKHGEVTRTKLAKQWEEMMLEIKLPQLKTEFQQQLIQCNQLAVNNIELMIDFKDFTISLLLDELDEAEEQRAFDLRSHCENIGSLYRIYLERLHTLKTDYEKELSEMGKAMFAEVDYLIQKSEDADSYIKTMIYGLSCHEKQLVNMGRSMYMSKQKELEQKYLDDLNIRRKKEEDKFENVWKTFVKHLEYFNEQVMGKVKDYDDRMDRDVAIVEVIKNQTRELFHAQNVLRTTKELQEVEKDKVNKRMMDLNREKVFFNEMLLKLKQSYEQDIICDKKVILQLVCESNKTLKNLKNKVTIAEKLLRFYTLVRKFETRREKILPFPKSYHRKLRADVEPHLKSLSHFFQKCAVADTGRNNVNAEYVQLLEENHSLKHAIKSCISYDCNEKLPPLSPIIASRIKRCIEIPDLSNKL